MTERDAAGKYAASTPAQKLKAQIGGSFKPPSGFAVRIENGAQTRARIEKQLGIEQRPPVEKKRSTEDADSMLRRMFDDRTRDKRVDVTEGGNR